MGRISLFFLVAAMICASTAATAPPPGGTRLGESTGQTYLSRCSLLPTDAKIWSCYVTRLLADVEKSGDPAHELPRIDRKVRAGGGYLLGNCHMMMHVVGRKFALRHDVSLGNLQKYLPRSNDPGCSAGFGMGMVMTLGKEIGRLGPDGAVKLCERAPTRFRSYTCIHTLGHAYMRLYHGALKYGIKACRALPPAEARDCAQGAFHDYWLSVAGRDSAERQRNPVMSARTLCAKQIRAFVRGCWYRYFLELPPKVPPASPAAVRRLCSGLVSVQRSGCVAAASLITSADPFIQMRICARLSGSDAVSCLWGLNIQNLATSRGSQRVRLVESCADMPRSARSRCFEWLGTGLAVITNGRFRELGCPYIERVGRQPCLAGARRMNQALVTFS